MGNQLELKPVNGSFSLKEHIYDVLKTSIMNLDIYDEGTNLRMDERTLAEQLGISRTPIREAIMRLEQEGFVDIQPRRGVFIKRKSLDEILEMIVVWAALESMAARLACQYATAEEISELRRLGTKYTKDRAKAEMSEYSEANIEFHLFVLRLSKTKMIETIAQGLFTHLKAVRRKALRDTSRADRSVVDHMHIIEAIEARDADLAGELVREHTMRLHAYIRRSWRYIVGDAIADQSPTTLTETTQES
ncbi:GntR family transcriptional regulator [Limibaculum sp. M0105]|uniref:GntR family transcriptional regulator n=1 Tax=Thermohalobaculum xanthum TaxID=2753746 RepID=A0A8J7M8K6_9RHOB|nr:GntR family transcriptional regulator [Thermohalobaculum xanthum]MBK0400594.1 GntR family transcriptional regulator [Thermohalobaculum xanthum]